jgi:membrane-associated phospholipid phosphatase
VRILFSILACLCCISCDSQTLNYRILKSINEGDHPKWDKAMKVVSDGVLPVYAASNAAVLVVGYANNDDLLIRSGYKMAVAQLTNLVFTEGIKRTVRNKRPYDCYPGDIICNYKPHGFSFPSGHTSHAFCTATSLTLATRKWYVAVPAYAYASFVAYSRMRLGAHFPGDVLIGMALGIGTSLLTWQADQWLNNK